MTAWRYLDLADFALIAEAVLGVPAERLLRMARLDLVESALAAPRAEFGGEEFYPDIAEKAAILGSRVIRNHPLPDGNKRVGYLSMLGFVALERGLVGGAGRRRSRGR